jgi:hypothetical protein
MTHELKKRLDAIRAVAPRIKAASDQADNTVKAVEQALVREIGIGISAESSEYFPGTQRRRDPQNWDEFIEEETRERLALGRATAGEYCIHVKSLVCVGEYQCDEAELTSTPWSQCDRETRLRTFYLLPNLLKCIARKAEQLAESTEKTAATLNELLGGDDALTTTEPVQPESTKNARPIGLAARVVEGTTRRRSKDYRPDPPSAKG